MASNPPFQVEDNTDEDFFDQLVADDYGTGVSAAAGSDSDDAKAFANLSMEDSGGEGGIEAKLGSSSVDVGAESSGAHEEEKNLLEDSNSVALESVAQSNSEGIGSEVVMDSAAGTGIGSEVAIDSAAGTGIGSEVAIDSAVDTTIGSVGSGVKEVGWSSFYADSEQNSGNAFGSYSEFFGEFGDGSGDFPGKVEENLNGQTQGIPATEEFIGNGLDNSVNYAAYNEVQAYGTSLEPIVDGQDMNSSQYWENLYPGWKYDSSTGQWYQVEGYDVTTANAQVSNVNNSANDWNAISGGQSDVSYLQTAQSVAGTVTETSTSKTVSNWNQVSQVNGGYPEHMVFDPQYPGWYFDTIGQEWRTLESYTSSLQTTVQAQDQNGFASFNAYNQNNNYQDYGQANNYASQSLVSQGEAGSWGQSYGNYSQQGVNMWQPEPVPNKDSTSTFGGTQQLENSYGSKVFTNNQGNREIPGSSFGDIPSHDNSSHFHGEANGTSELHNFAPVGNFSQHLNQASTKHNVQMNFSNNYYNGSKSVNDYHGSQEPVNFMQQSFQSGHQLSPDTGRSSAGRPPHALVTFGFGGKLVIMKDNSLINSYGSQNPAGGSISVLNLMEVVMGNAIDSSPGFSSCDYFRALCQQSFPGPLAGGSVGNKELNKWLDERIAGCESANMDYRKSHVLRLLLCLLKISCQHYGKLRSPFGNDSTIKEDDLPESAVAKLFASAKRNDGQYRDYGGLSQCLQNLPSEGQIQATASQVQTLLVSGRKIDALQCARDGQLWGPALVLASQLGDQFYGDTVKQMALQQLVAGSPMRTLCLLIAGQPADVFSTDASSSSRLPAAMNMSQQPAQFGANGMLDDWEENLAVITANRTKDDELVIIHLGDCLWRERSEILAAHICYLIAEANFESYSDSARLCLIGADHWKLPRTYASPEAIQMTELYEYSKVLGNSQFILLPFQPYKLVYAHMLAEVGKVSDSLKYCQVVLKSLKTGRSPEVETWKQLVLSLEERIKTHQQGGYAVNLAPSKLVGKLLNFFDSTAHRVVGSMPPPPPSISQGSVLSNEQYNQPMGPRVSTSQSTMAMTSLVPSASMEPISERRADDNRMTAHSRSVSEPDMGRTPRQVDSSRESRDETPAESQNKSPSGGSGASRLTRFGFGTTILQKTMGLVLRSRSDKQAKLGEKNKFYYDEKLKRWVEEGVDPPAEEAALPPPPTTATFQNGASDYNLKAAIRSEGSSPTGSGSPKYKSTTPREHASGIPPIPPSSNQFSARGRMGVRSRYVDTFNQGGGNTANLFQSPSVKPSVAANAKFFIPAAVLSSEATTESASASASSGDQTREASPAPASSEHVEDHSNENTSTSNMNYSFQSPPPSTSLQRFSIMDNPIPARGAKASSSMDNIQSRGAMGDSNGAHATQSRRTVSWSGGSGSFNDAYKPSPHKPAGLGTGMPQLSLMPSNPSTRMPNGGSFGDLQEVEL